MVSRELDRYCLLNRLARNTNFIGPIYIIEYIYIYIIGPIYIIGLYIIGIYIIRPIYYRIIHI